MKKILLLTENFPPIDGGSGRWFWELYSRLPRQNIIVASHSVEGYQAFDKQHDLHVIRMPMHSAEWGVKSKTGISFYFRMVKHVLKLVKRHKIDEIHCGRVIHEGVIARIIKLLTGVPFICFVHGEDVETAATSREQALLVKWACRGSKTLVCNSENSRNLVAALGFETKNKCEVLHPGVDTSKFIPALADQAFRTQMGWDGKRVLLTVGRLQRRKGQDHLLAAMPELLKIYPELFYAIVGRGECEDELRSFIDSSGLSSSAAVYTDLNDEALIKSYQQCDIFILPNRTIESDIEGFGMVLVEAQACGRPVIAGNSGGTAETMIIGKTGEIIDCSSPQSIVKGMLPILQDSSFEHFGKSAVEHVKTSFDWDAHVKKAKALFGL